MDKPDDGTRIDCPLCGCKTISDFRYDDYRGVYLIIWRCINKGCDYVYVV